MAYATLLLGLMVGPVDSVLVVSPGPAFVAVRGEPVRIEVDVRTDEFIASATLRTLKAPVGGLSPRAVAQSVERGQQERFAFALDTDRLPVGEYLFVVQANRLSGEQIRSEARVRVRLVDAAPIALSARPPVGAALGASPALTGTVAADFDARTISVLKDGAKDAQVSGSSFAIPWDESEEIPGEHTITAQAIDKDGWVYTTPPVTVTVPERIRLRGFDGRSPVVIRPGNTRVAGGVDVLAEGTVVRVEFLKDGRVVTTATQQPWDASWDGSASQDCTCEISARAVLADGSAWRSRPVRVALLNYIVNLNVAEVELAELDKMRQRLSQGVGALQSTLQRSLRDSTAGGSGGFGSRRLNPVERGTVMMSDRANLGRLTARYSAVRWQCALLRIKIATNLLYRNADSRDTARAKALLRQVVSDEGLDSAFGQEALGVLQTIPDGRPGKSAPPLHGSQAAQPARRREGRPELAPCGDRVTTFSGNTMRCVRRHFFVRLHGVWLSAGHKSVPAGPTVAAGQPGRSTPPVPLPASAPCGDRPEWMESGYLMCSQGHLFVKHKDTWVPALPQPSR